VGFGAGQTAQPRGAALAKPENITGFGETVAVNRGANFAVFSDGKAAHEWLQEQSVLEKQ